MRNKKRYSIDGFISSDQLSKPSFKDTTSKTKLDQKPAPVVLEKKLESSFKPNLKVDHPPLKNIELESGRPLSSDDAKKAPKTLWRRAIRSILILIAIVVISGGGYLFYKANRTMGSVLSGNWLGLASADPLKKDANGRTNVLIFGTSEDRQDNDGSGENLTDSIMLLSYKEQDKDLAMVSFPRDLWVKLAETCVVGNQEKLNTVYFCGSDNGKNEAAGAEALKAKIEEITGLSIQYYTHLNFSAVVSLVDAVDGVDVAVQGSGPVPYGVKPGSILDRNMDWMCNHQCYLVKYEPGVHHMDGKHALAFMRARNAPDAVGYGLPRSNFDREQNQQKVLTALIKKLTDSSTLINYSKVVKIIEAIGQNLRTNVDAKEIRSVLEVVKSATQNESRSLKLVDGDGGDLVRNGTMLGRSVVLPVAGSFDYSQIRSFLQKQLANPALIREAARVGVYNATETPGLAQKTADQLTGVGLEVAQIGNSPVRSDSSPSIMVYSLTTDKPKSLAEIERVLGAKLIEGIPEFTYDRTLDFVVVRARNE